MRRQAARLLSRTINLRPFFRLAATTRACPTRRMLNTISSMTPVAGSRSAPPPIALQPFKTHPPSAYPGSPRVHSFYDDPTATWTFVVADSDSRKAIVVDPVLDYDPSAGRISQKSVKGLAAFLQQEGYTVERICETHVHADHLTGAYALKNVSRSRGDG